jgi:hypothetical protein
MEINYELTPDDFVRFGRETAPAQSAHKPFVILYLILYGLFIFGDILYGLLTGSIKDWTFGMILTNIALRTIICFGALFVALGILKLIVKRKGEKVLREPQNGLFCEHRLILTEKELIELTDVNTSRYSWKAIGAIKELENFVQIDISMSSSYIIPKRYFEDRKTARAFVETAEQYRQNALDNYQLSHFIEYEKGLE